MLEVFHWQRWKHIQVLFLSKSISTTSTKIKAAEHSILHDHSLNL